MCYSDLLYGTASRSSRWSSLPLGSVRHQIHTRTWWTRCRPRGFRNDQTNMASCVSGPSGPLSRSGKQISDEPPVNIQHDQQQGHSLFLSIQAVFMVMDISGNSFSHLNPPGKEKQRALLCLLVLLSVSVIGRSLSPVLSLFRAISKVSVEKRKKYSSYSLWPFSTSCRLIVRSRVHFPSQYTVNCVHSNDSASWQIVSTLILTSMALKEHKVEFIVLKGRTYSFFLIDYTFPPNATMKFSHRLSSF